MFKRCLVLASLAFLPLGAQANDVLEELSTRSSISTDELEEILDDCDGSQMAMNICASYDAVEAELNLGEVVDSKARDMSKADGKAYRETLAEWQVEAEQACLAQADDEAEGGSMHPMIYSMCLADALNERAAEEAESD